MKRNTLSAAVVAVLGVQVPVALAQEPDRECRAGCTGRRGVRARRVRPGGKTRHFEISNVLSTQDLNFCRRRMSVRPCPGWRGSAWWMGNMCTCAASGSVTPRPC